MSINCLACTQSIVNKNPSGPVLPAIQQTMTNIYTLNPFFYWGGDSGTIVNNASGKVIAYRQTVPNQISPFLFKNGMYYAKTSETTATVNNQNWDLYTNYMGDYNNIADTPWLSPTTYNASTGVYAGSVSTTTSGTTVNGEWIQLQIPYKLYITSYQVHTNAANVGAGANAYFPKSFYLCASNDGTTWTTIDNRSNLTCNTNGFNYFTVPTLITIGYSYFRLVGTLVGNTKMSVMVGFGGTYRG